MTTLPHIPDAEFQKRVERTRQAMQSAGLDLLLAFSTESEPAHVRYYADYWPSFETTAVLIPLEKPAALLIGPETRTYATARSKIPQIFQLKDFRESSQPDYPGSKLPDWRDIIGEYQPRRIGIAGWHMFPHTMMENLRVAAGAAEIVNADEVVRSVTLAKTENELNCMRRAAKISELGFKAILENIKVTSIDLQKLRSKKIKLLKSIA